MRTVIFLQCTTMKRVITVFPGGKFAKPIFKTTYTSNLFYLFTLSFVCSGLDQPWRSLNSEAQLPYKVQRQSNRTGTPRNRHYQ